MELRQLEAFVAVAAELHFGRAAERLHIGQPTLSELIRRLERELGTPLFTRTTRRVALTGAEFELLGRAKVILDEIASATAAVRRIAHGDAGTVRVGITPPVAPVLAPHLRDTLAVTAPDIVVDIQRMWLPDLATAVTDGRIDIAITCGVVPAPEGVVGEVFCAETLLVALRPDHHLAAQDTVSLADLAHAVLGVPSDALFPAWALCQRQALATAGVAPPQVVLEATDLTATAWTDQEEVDWILLTPSLHHPRARAVARPVSPPQSVPFTLQWSPDRAQNAAVARFVRHALSINPPPGWQARPPRHGAAWSPGNRPSGTRSSANPRSWATPSPAP